MDKSNLIKRLEDIRAELNAIDMFDYLRIQILVTAEKEILRELRHCN